MGFGVKRKTVDRLSLLFSVLITILLGIAFSWNMISVRWNQKYDVDDYNCVHMSYDVGRFFKSIGIPTQVVYGSNPNCSGGHCWLLLWGWLEFESTHLSPVVFNRNSDRFENIIVVELE